jgi:hypothetical protein
MSAERAQVLHQLEREAFERTRFDVEQMPVRIACELMLLRRLHAACTARDARGLPNWRAIRRALDHIPAPEAIEQWDALVLAAEALERPALELAP